MTGGLESERTKVATRSSIDWATDSPARLSAPLRPGVSWVNGAHTLASRAVALGVGHRLRGNPDGNERRAIPRKRLAAQGRFNSNFVGHLRKSH